VPAAGLSWPDGGNALFGGAPWDDEKLGAVRVRGWVDGVQVGGGTGPWQPT